MASSTPLRGPLRLPDHICKRSRHAGRFVPPLTGAGDRHVFIDSIGPVQFFHYDPYSQLFSKIVRGFRRDLDDARHLVDGGMVDPECFRELVDRVPETAFAHYPRLSPKGVGQAVDAFLGQ